MARPLHAVCNVGVVDVAGCVDLTFSSQQAEAGVTAAQCPGLQEDAEHKDRPHPDCDDRKGYSGPAGIAPKIAPGERKQECQTIRPIAPGLMPTASSMLNSRVRSSTDIRSVLRMIKATTTTRAR